jgi:hypothetical protein
MEIRSKVQVSKLPSLIDNYHTQKKTQHKTQKTQKIQPTRRKIPPNSKGRTKKVARTALRHSKGSDGNCCRNSVVIKKPNVGAVEVRKPTRSQEVHMKRYNLAVDGGTGGVSFAIPVIPSSW